MIRFRLSIFGVFFSGTGTCTDPVSDAAGETGAATTEGRTVGVMDCTEGRTVVAGACTEGCTVAAGACTEGRTVAVTGRTGVLEGVATVGRTGVFA